MVLETPRERVTMLKAGFNGKQIEALYVVLNGLKIATSWKLENV